MSFTARKTPRPVLPLHNVFFGNDLRRRTRPTHNRVTDRRGPFSSPILVRKSFAGNTFEFCNSFFGRNLGKISTQLVFLKAVTSRIPPNDTTPGFRGMR